MRRILRFNDWPLAVKLIVGMVALSVIALTAVTVLTNGFTRRAMQTTMEEQFTTFAQEQGSQIGPLLEHEVNLLYASLATEQELVSIVGAFNETYTGSPQEIEAQIIVLDEAWQAGTNEGQSLINDRTTNETSRRFEDFLAVTPYHLEVFITDRYGAVVSASNPTSDYYQADEGWWQAAWNNGEGAYYLSDPVYDESVQALVIEFSLPITDLRSGEVVGVLKSGYDLTSMVDHVRGINFGEQSGVHLYNAHSQYIVDPHGDPPGTAVEEGYLLDGAIYSGVGFSVDALDHDGERLVAAYAPVTTAGTLPVVDDLGWVVQVTQPYDVAFAAITQNTLLAAILTVVAAVAAAVLAYLFARLLSRQVNEIQALFTKVAIGEFGTRARVYGRDELGQTADGVNAMLQMLTDIMSETEQVADIRLAVLENTDNFVGIATPDAQAIYINPAGLKMVGRGDEAVSSITVSSLYAPEYADVVTQQHIPSAIREGSWNGETVYIHKDGSTFPVYELIMSIRDNEGEVVAVATIGRDITEQQEVEEQIRAQNEALALALEDLRQVATEVETTAEEVTTASDTMHEVVTVMTDQATSSADVAAQAATSADEGERAVTDTIAAMNRIRVNIQETAQRIKRLGEVTQEIGEATRLIEDLADRTTVLALNASIQAASAGEAGRGFAVVAEEVQRLAERATGATRQIEDLITNIRAEANEAMVGVEEVTREVVEGSTLAHNAGDHMTMLNDLADQLSNLIQHLAETTAVQTTESLSTLGELTEGLRASVAGFHTPDASVVGGNGSHQLVQS